MSTSFSNLTIGVLAVQGCVTPHCEKLDALETTVRRVRKPADLEGLHGLILPGGESTTMLKLIRTSGLENPLAETLARIPSWGICAGSILLAQKVLNPEQFSFGVLPVTVERNAYGSQIDSFKTELLCNLRGHKSTTVPADFIRAPRIVEVSDETEVLCTHSGSPVLVQYRNVLAATFHTELTNDTTLHRYFLERCAMYQRDSGIVNIKLHHNDDEFTEQSSNNRRA